LEGCRNDYIFLTFEKEVQGINDVIKCIFDGNAIKPLTIMEVKDG